MIFTSITETSALFCISSSQPIKAANDAFDNCSRAISPVTLTLSAFRPLRVRSASILSFDIGCGFGGAPQNPQPISKESIEADLTRRGLKAESVNVTGEIARLQLSNASFAALIGWLDEIQKSALVSVMEVNIIALPQPDAVNATLTLRQQKGE